MPKAKSSAPVDRRTFLSLAPSAAVAASISVIDPPHSEPGPQGRTGIRGSRQLEPKHARAPTPRVTTPDRLVLLGQPDVRNVPYFAMGVPCARESSFRSQHVSRDKIVELVGRRCAEWIERQSQIAPIQLLHTRNYLHPQTAFYATWLLFQNRAEVNAFAQAWPRHCLRKRVEQMAEEHQELAANLEMRRCRGDFDLSRVGDERQRENLARKYTGFTDKLHKLLEHSRVLEQACALGIGWEQNLGTVAPSDFVRQS